MSDNVKIIFIHLVLLKVDFLPYAVGMESSRSYP